MAIDDRDALLINWRHVPVLTSRRLDTWGNVWYDPVAGLWRQVTAYQTLLEIYMSTGPTPRGPWSGRTKILDQGETGAWDDYALNVPFMWYEAGQTRPWRMTYIGMRSTTNYQIGLATSVDGVTWERKDTQGNTLTDAVLKCGAALQWDDDDLDYGGLIKVGDTYYLYYDTILIGQRKIGLATSTDLVTWTKHAGNPLWSGVDGYWDKDHTDASDLAQGFFCPDIVRWDKADGTVRYLMILPHYVVASPATQFQVYTDTSPVFAKTTRTYVGKFCDVTTDALTLDGTAVTSSDVPRIITDTIERNVKTSLLTGDEVLCMESLYAGVWMQTFASHHKTFNGATLSDICLDLPNNDPELRIMPAPADADYIGLWLFGATMTPMDWSGNGYHMIAEVSDWNSSGPLFGAATYMQTGISGTAVAALDAVTGDFTIEIEASFASDYTTGTRTLLGYSNDVGNHHFYLYVAAAAGPTYTLKLAITSAVDSTSKVASVALGAITLNQIYNLAITRTAGHVYFFKDGVELTASKADAILAITIKTLAIPFRIGAQSTGLTAPWVGRVRGVGISDVARWTADYTAAPLGHIYKASGNLFTRVSDFAAAGAGGLSLATTVPANTSITQKGRNAANVADKSVDDGDFTALTTSVPATRYQQFELALATTDTAVTPSGTKCQPYQHELLDRKKVKRGTDRGDGLKGLHRSINRL